jgi:hypothetical protein
MSAILSIGLKLLLGGFNLLKKLFELLWNVRLPTLLPAVLLLMWLHQAGEARHWHKASDRQAAIAKQCNQGRANDRAAWAAAQAKAIAIATEQKRTTEAKYAKIQKEQADEHKAHLADAGALLASRLRDGALKSGSGPADLRGPASAAPGPDGTPVAAIVDVADLERCTASVVKLEGWQSWWTEIEKTRADK